uniref:SAC3/GANP/THP3 conserved domain-containing protein n=1 Tax=Ditylenchus dipsaci TaxID=166011 RepID=A0A915D142_9BILA
MARLDKNVFADYNNSSKSKKQSKKQQKAALKGVSPAIPFTNNAMGNNNKNSNWSVVEAPDKKQIRARRFEQYNQEQEQKIARRCRLSAQQRFDYFNGGVQAVGDSNAGPDVVGTCMDIEKSFFRLTAAAEPSQVRPLRILMKALEVVKQKYKTNSDYRYTCDQLKSIRQDLMIQNIRNDFTVLVYESNARIALENKDREEFNQCQNQLKVLYSEVDYCSNRWEFTSYRLLYYIYMNEILDVSTLLDELQSDALKDQCMNFALSVWDAWSSQNYGEKTVLHVHTQSISSRDPLSIVADWFGMKERELVDWLTEKGISTEIGGNLDCRQHANTQL